MIKIPLIVIASIVGFVALFYIALWLASRGMRRTAMAFVIALMEERYRHAQSMLEPDTLAGMDHRLFIRWLKQQGLYDLVQYRRYLGDYGIGVRVGSLTPLLIREDGTAFTVTFSLRKIDNQWFITAIEAGTQVLSAVTMLPDQSMERAEARVIYKRQRRHVQAVFNKHINSVGCPCKWKQFVFWAGKHHGRGRHDELQNDLVKVALGSGIFEAVATAEDPTEGAATVRCKQCDTLWQHFSDEWRMGAIAHRLFCTDSRAEDISVWQGYESDRIFRTAGAEEPPDAFTLGLDEWVLFMTAPLPSPSALQ